MFIEKKASKCGNTIGGITIYPEDEKIYDALKKHNVKEIFVAIGKMDNDAATRIFEFYSKTSCKIKIYDTPVKDFERSDKGDEQKMTIRNFEIDDLLFRSPLNINHWYFSFFCIIYCILSSAFFAIEYGNDSGCVIYHPLISDLEARSAIAMTDVFHKIGSFKYILVLYLPFPTPCFLKPSVRAGTYQPDIVSFIAKSQYNLSGPNVNTPCHAGNEDIYTVIHRLPNHSFQITLDC